jgi:hypothetical protein
MEKIGPEIASDIDWKSCRLLCIAGDFKKYDQHAAGQINRNIELIRYTRYGDEFLLLDLVNTTVVSDSVAASSAPKKRTKSSTKTSTGMVPVEEVLAGLDGPFLDTYEGFKDSLLGLGDDVRIKNTKVYVAFRWISGGSRPTSTAQAAW